MPMEIISNNAAAVSALNSLLHTVQEANLYDDGHHNDLDIHTFKHGDAQLHGLAATKNIGEGDIVFSVPEQLLTSPKDLHGKRFHGEGTSPMGRVGLWLAEKRVELLGDKGAADLSPRDKFFADYLRSMPTLEDYHSAGLPVVASKAQLKRLKGLPHLDEIARFAQEVQTMASHDLPLYNDHRGDHAELKLEDVLWGDATAVKHAISCGGDPMVMPLGDVVNHMPTGKANVAWECDWMGNRIVYSALRDIHKNDELTLDYATGYESVTDADREVNLLKLYGIVEEDVHPQPWDPADCKKIRHADFAQDSGPMLNLVDKLVANRCPKHALAGGDHSAAAGHQAKVSAAGHEKEESAAEHETKESAAGHEAEESEHPASKEDLKKSTWSDVYDALHGSKKNKQQAMQPLAALPGPPPKFGLMANRRQRRALDVYAFL